MTTRIDGSSSAVRTPEHDEVAAPEPREHPKQQSNELASWSSPAADQAVQSIESSWGFGFHPDMKAIDADLSKLDGFALLKTLNRLDADDKLESILNRMSTAERQQVINQAVKGNLLDRAPNEKLKTKFDLPASFQKMVDELNTLQFREKPKTALTYNWSSYEEDAHDVAKRKFADQIATLEPGDSIELDAKLGVAGHTVSAAAEGKVNVKRGTDGKYTVASDVAVDAGLEEHLSGVEAKLGAGARVEYRFDSAGEAMKAAHLFASSPPEAVEKYGRPAVLELRGKAAAELSQSLGFKVAELHLEGAAETQLVLRAELDGTRPSLSLIAEAKVEAKAAPRAGAFGLTAEARGYEAKVTEKIAFELRAPLADADAFVKAPIDYVRQNAAAMRGSAEAKATVTNEKTVLHHSTTTTLSVSTKPEELQRVAQRVAGSTDWRQIVMGMGRGIDVDVREKKMEVKHAGLDLKLDAGNHVGFKAGAGYERKTLESERVLYRGAATDFVLGRR